MTTHYHPDGQTPLTTTIRHYSLWAEACSRVDKALAAKHAAFLAMEKDNNAITRAAFSDADQGVTKALRERNSVSIMKKQYRLGES